MSSFKERFGNVFLENAQKAAEEQPGTFIAPDIEKLKDLKKGDGVQICIYKTVDGHAMKPWLDVLEIRGVDIKCSIGQGFNRAGIPALGNTQCAIPYRFICDYKNEEKEIKDLRCKVIDLIEGRSGLFETLEQKDRKISKGEHDRLVELLETITSFMDRTKALETKRCGNRR